MNNVLYIGGLIYKGLSSDHNRYCDAPTSCYSRSRAITVLVSPLYSLDGSHDSAKNQALPFNNYIYLWRGDMSEHRRQRGNRWGFTSCPVTLISPRRRYITENINKNSGPFWTRLFFPCPFVRSSSSLYLENRDNFFFPLLTVNVSKLRSIIVISVGPLLPSFFATVFHRNFNRNRATFLCLYFIHPSFDIYRIKNKIKTTLLLFKIVFSHKIFHSHPRNKL